MSASKLTEILIPLVFIIGIWGTSGLVYTEFSKGSVCPKLFTIPACYIIALCLVIPFASHIFQWDNIYFIGTGLAFSIALFGTISNVAGLTQCPQTSSGIPMCYISLALFTSLIVLKIVHRQELS